MLPVAGAVVGVLGMVLVLFPSALMDAWAWRLTPLMSQVIGGWLLFIAAGGLAALVDQRYSSFRPYFVTSAIWFTILFVGGLFNSNDFDWGKVTTYLFFVGLAVATAVLIATSLYMERGLKANTSAA